MLLVLVILLGVWGFFTLPLYQDSPLGTVPSKSSDGHQGNGSGFEGSAQADSEESIEAVPQAIATKNKEEQAIPVEEAFDYEQSLLVSINEMGLSGRWSYDEKVKNLAVWEGLCLARDDSKSTLIDGSDESDALLADLEKLCEDFSAVPPEVDDFLQVEIDERALGINDRADLEMSLDELGPDAATVLAIQDLSRALEALDYARTLEVVWFLGIYNFDGASEEFKIYQRQPRVETIFAVSASVFCNYLGNCRESHPVVLNLCFQFPDRPCFRQPVDIYDAVGQILTGYEIETFNEMNGSLVRLLNRYHSDDP